MRPVVILFAKAPAPGRVKTRLAAGLGGAAAAALHEAFAADLLDALAPHCSLELHTDIETDAWTASQVPRRLQAPGDLGARMFHALDAALREGCPSAAIVGTDAPTLPVELVLALFDLAADVTLGPAPDGGFWGVAARRVHPAMFHGVDWSTPLVLAQTRAACHAAGLTTALGPAWYDVDTREDLLRLAADPRLPSRPRTHALIQSLVPAAESDN